MKMHQVHRWLWKVLWALSALSFVLAWVTVIIQQPIWRLDPLFLLWNALILAVLAAPMKLDCNNCKVCSADSHMSV